MKRSPPRWRSKKRSGSASRKLLTKVAKLGAWRQKSEPEIGGMAGDRIGWRCVTRRFFVCGVEGGGISFAATDCPRNIAESANRGDIGDQSDQPQRDDHRITKRIRKFARRFEPGNAQCRQARSQYQIHRALRAAHIPLRQVYLKRLCFGAGIADHETA